MFKTRLSFLFLLLAASAQAAEVTRVQYLMGTVCEIEAEAPTQDQANAAITSAFEEIARLENILSTYQEDSEVSRLLRDHKGKPVVCSPELLEILQWSQRFATTTNGAFDVTLVKDGSKKILLDEENRSLLIKDPSLRLDFGGIGKGYALDKAGVVLLKGGVTKAKLNFSGNLLLINKEERPFVISVADPKESQNSVLTIGLARGSVSTSSQLEKPGHIINPVTGKPANFQGSVTVVAQDGTTADALSTALLVMGPEKGLPWLESTYEDVAALFLAPSDSGWKKIATKNFSNLMENK